MQRIFVCWFPSMLLYAIKVGRYRGPILECDSEVWIEATFSHGSTSSNRQEKSRHNSHQRNTLRLGSKTSNKEHSFSCPYPLDTHGRSCSCHRQLVTKLRIWYHGSQPPLFRLISTLDTSLKILSEMYWANKN